MKKVNKNEKGLVVGSGKPVTPKHTISSSVRSETIDYKKQGKRNRRMGADFERRTRKDLEDKGWIVSKWVNNVDFIDEKYTINGMEVQKEEIEKIEYKIVREMSKEGQTGLAAHTQKWKIGKCIPAKPSRFQLHGTGFPDFFAYRRGPVDNYVLKDACMVIFVECKVNGNLSKIEKEKAQWYLKNGYCSRFFVAYKTKEKNKVKVNYKEIENEL